MSEGSVPPREAVPSGEKLAFKLDSWEVLLTAGVTVSVYAHAYGYENGEFVFSALVEGPVFEVEIARFPSQCVVCVRGG